MTDQRSIYARYDKIYTLGGTPVASLVEFNREMLIPTNPFKDAYLNKEEFSRYGGIGGATVTHIYLRTVIIPVIACDCSGS
jgi:hypothetical protein